MVLTRAAAARQRRSLRQVYPTDEAGFSRMSLQTLSQWLGELSDTHRRALQVDGRTIIRSFLRHLQLDRVRLNNICLWFGFYFCLWLCIKIVDDNKP